MNGNQGTTGFLLPRILAIVGIIAAAVLFWQFEVLRLENIQLKQQLQSMAGERHLPPVGAPPRMLDPVYQAKRLPVLQKLADPSAGLAFTEDETSILINEIAEAVGQVETGGVYSKLGPKVNGHDDHRAWGKYQVMWENIPPWTLQALGRSMTPQEFLADHDAQDRVARYKMRGYWNTYHTPQDVISIWFTGRPYAQAVSEGARDVNMRVEEYVRRVMDILLNQSGVELPPLPKLRIPPLVANNHDEPTEPIEPAEPARRPAATPKPNAPKDELALGPDDIEFEY